MEDSKKKKVKKIENLKVEIDKYGASIASLNEVRWTEQGDIVYGNYTIFYSSGNTAEIGVAIMMKNKLANGVTKVQYVNVVKIGANTVNVFVYADTGLS